MKQKIVIIVLAALVVVLTALIFVVKGNATTNAQARVKEAQETVSTQKAWVKTVTDNNNLLWSVIDSVWKSPDKSKAFVKGLAEAQRLPRCNLKNCEEQEDEAKLKIAEDAGSMQIGWGKHSFKVSYDNRNRFVALDVGGMLNVNLEYEGGN